MDRKAFRRPFAFESVPEDFAHATAGIAEFLGPILSHLAEAAPIPGHWTHPGPWRA